MLTCGVISPHVIIEVMESHLDKREVSCWQAELGGGLVKLNTYLTTVWVKQRDFR